MVRGTIRKGPLDEQTPGHSVGLGERSCAARHGALDHVDGVPAGRVRPAVNTAHQEEGRSDECQLPLFADRAIARRSLW